MIDLAMANLPSIFCLIVWSIGLVISFKEKNIFQIVIRAYLVIAFYQSIINGTSINPIFIILAFVELVLIAIKVKMEDKN